MKQGFRIALTGGPGGGKTTAADLFRRELGEQVVIVPEAATLLYSGGYPRYRDDEAVRIVQGVIYHLQRGLEDTQAARYPERILLCDRGTVDAAAYWPERLGGPDQFFAPMGTSFEDELARYDAVLFFESAAVGGIGIEGGNPARIETIDEAAVLDRRLRALWSRHPRFTFVSNHVSFIRKITAGLDALQTIVSELRGA